MNTNPFTAPAERQSAPGRRQRSAAGPLCKWWRHNSKVILKTVGGLIAMAAFSIGTQRMTAGSLWYPKEWRLTIQFLVAFSAGTLILLSSALWRVIFERKSLLKSQLLSNNTKPLWKAAVASCLIAGASVALWNTYTLRSLCVKELKVTREWWILNYGTERFSNFNEVQAALKADPEHEFRLKGVPAFLDPENNTIFLPPEFCDRFKTELVEWGTHSSSLRLGEKNAEERGLQVLLETDPMRLINWSLTEEIARIREKYVGHFFKQHMLMLLLLACAWGILPESAHVVVDEVTGNAVHGASG